MGKAIKELLLLLKVKDCICSIAGTAAMCPIYTLLLFTHVAYYFIGHMAFKSQKELMLLHCVCNRKSLFHFYEVSLKRDLCLFFDLSNSAG